MHPVPVPKATMFEFNSEHVGGKITLENVLFQFNFGGRSDAQMAQLQYALQLLCQSHHAEIQSVKERLDEQKQITRQWKFCSLLVPVIVVYLLSPHIGLLFFSGWLAVACLAYGPRLTYLGKMKLPKKDQLRGITINALKHCDHRLHRLITKGSRFLSRAGNKLLARVLLGSRKLARVKNAAHSLTLALRPPSLKSHGRKSCPRSKSGNSVSRS